MHAVKDKGASQDPDLVDATLPNQGATPITAEMANEAIQKVMKNPDFADIINGRGPEIVSRIAGQTMGRNLTLKEKKLFDISA